MDNAIDQLIAKITANKNLGPLVTHHHVMEPCEPVTAPFPEGLAPAVVGAIRARGIETLYSHQAQACAAALAGRGFVAVTPTASGKTLCYNLPVLSALAEDAGARALYLFPTKALAQDQLAELQAYNEVLAHPLPAHTYDGDTPQDVRRKIRDEARIVLSNPDMLHTAILPHHPRWASFFAGLRYVVIDEMHVYKGVFGSHMANVIRRLTRVAHFHGAAPVFLLSSATIANPEELARRLTGEEDLVPVTRSGAPRGKKHLLFMNPPIIDEAMGVRGSPVTLARKLARRFLAAKTQMICFVRSRLQVEVLTRYLQELEQKIVPDRKKSKVRGYRGGYLPLLRREIEAGLRDGEVRAVVATNALELGIDIGQLEAAVLVGYPGSTASTLQQAGRAGRARQTSAAILVASSRPLDQYVIGHPETILERPPELALIDPENLLILASHVKCAAFELPFRRGERFGPDAVDDILDYLVEEGLLHRSPDDAYHWSDQGYPADKVALRTADPENFTVVEDREGRHEVIAEVDYDSAPLTIHPNAIYMVQGRSYHVDTLDWDGRKAHVRRVDAEYYTQAINYSKVRILDDFASTPGPSHDAGWGEVHVLSRVPGFKKIRYYTLENIGYGEVDLPDLEMHTHGAWWAVDPALADRLALPFAGFLDALAGVSYGLQNMAAFHCLCDVNDLGRAIGDVEGRWSYALHRTAPGASRFAGEFDPGAEEPYRPALFLYESYPGGCGLAEAIHLRADALIDATLELVGRCPCEAGCPSCVGPSEREGAGSRKAAALAILHALSKRSA